MNKTQFFINKSKLVLLMLGCLLLIGGAWYMMVSSGFGHIIYFSLGFVGLLFFTVAFIGSIRLLISTNPAIEIDNEGLTDNSTVISMGRVLWSEIESSWLEYEEADRFQVDYVLTKERLAKMSGLLRFISKINRGWFQFDYGINSNLLLGDQKEILGALTSYKELNDPPFRK